MTPPEGSEEEAESSESSGMDEERDSESASLGFEELDSRFEGEQAAIESRHNEEMEIAIFFMGTFSTLARH